MEKLTAFILCGGKSSRMKSEKGLVLFQGKPFIEHIIQAVLPIT
ncbi:MAG TPA: NTP transferase domain-containing protein, partial [Flavobacterium sp.]